MLIMKSERISEIGKHEQPDLVELWKFRCTTRIFYAAENGSFKVGGLLLIWWLTAIRLCRKLTKFIRSVLRWIGAERYGSLSVRPILINRVSDLPVGHIWSIFMLPFDRIPNSSIGYIWFMFSLAFWSFFAHAFFRQNPGTWVKFARHDLQTKQGVACFNTHLVNVCHKMNRNFYEKSSKVACEFGTSNDELRITANLMLRLQYARWASFFSPFFVFLFCFARTCLKFFSVFVFPFKAFLFASFRFPDSVFSAPQKKKKGTQMTTARARTPSSSVGCPSFDVDELHEKNRSSTNVRQQHACWAWRNTG